MSIGYLIRREKTVKFDVSFALPEMKITRAESIFRDLIVFPTLKEEFAVLTKSTKFARSRCVIYLDTCLMLYEQITDS